MFKDDQGNDIVEGNVKPLDMQKKSALIDILDIMIKKIEELPQAAMSTPVTHYDYYSLVCLLSSIFKAS